MNNSQIMDEKMIRISDVLEQIADLNKMIELHQQEVGISSMLEQYKYMKNEFVQELNQLLSNFKIEVKAA